MIKLLQLFYQNITTERVSFQPPTHDPPPLHFYVAISFGLLPQILDYFFFSPRVSKVTSFK